MEVRPVVVLEYNRRHTQTPGYLGERPVGVQDRPVAGTPTQVACTEIALLQARV